MKTNIRIIGLLMFLLPLQLVGQQATIIPIQLPVEFREQRKIDITQDSKGQLWIATSSNGLLKYDGEQFVNYKPEINDINSAALPIMECIYADRDDHIWIGNFTDGLSRFNPETETFTNYKRDSKNPSSLSCDSIKTIMQDRDGLLWIGTKLGLDMFDPKTGSFTHITGDSGDALLLDKQDVRKVYEDSNGIIWIGSVCSYDPDQFDPLNGGLYKLDKTTGAITRYHHIDDHDHSLVDNRVRAIFEDSRGVFWVGTSSDGLHTMDREKGIFQRYPYDPDNPYNLSRPAVKYTYHSADYISFINEDAEGQIWIGTFCAGLSRYNPGTDKLVRFNTDEKAPFKTESNDFFSCIKTKDNLLWITDWYPGRNGYTFYRVSTSFNTLSHVNIGKSVYPFAQTTDSILWMGTSSGLVRKNSDGSFDTLFVSENKTGSENVINNLEPDQYNNLWASTNGGLFYFNSRTNHFKEYKYFDELDNLPLTSRSSWYTQLNGDGTITVIARRGMFIMDLKSGEMLDKYNIADVASTLNSIYDIHIDGENNYWLGTFGGLFQFDRTARKFHRLPKQQVRITSIHEDQMERLWIGTFNSGLFVYNLKTADFSPFSDSNNVIRNVGRINKITGDGDNNLWLLTRKGIVRVNPETKNTALFGKSWNIDLNSLTGSLWTSLNGELFIGNQTGYYHFFPKDIIAKNDITTDPFISNFFIGDRRLVSGDGQLEKPIAQTTEITLNHNQNNFTIEFDNMDFLTDPTEKILQCKLENYDDQWRTNDKIDKAYYFNVPPGNYVFHVRAVNMFGNSGEKTLTINITPPWYKTTLAYIIYALLLLLAIYIVHKFQRERVIKAERERTRERELKQAKEIEKAYTELKSTQSQLIQSEKMASLGELTAGIAHEIQNPLNFVNNFSEVNREMISEMKEEIDNGNYNEVKIIANDIEANEEKINHHGKRADAIVKGMLQHSRTSNGIKEPIDINALADEYLRLSYHGLRAKDKSFNADYKTDFDPNLPKINVIPQDISRVLLNLINNAFYAVDKRAKEIDPLTPPASGGIEERENEYKPTVTVSTAFLNPHSGGRGVKVVVKDNGGGIPAEIKDKIFQPFFTTKPTGQGTGLGLSLSYDIVKTHGGELRLETKHSKGSIFIISIPYG